MRIIGIDPASGQKGTMVFDPLHKEVNDQQKLPVYRQFKSPIKLK